MIIYSIYTGLDDNAEHFASKREAEKVARETLKFHDLDSVDIERHEVVPLTRASLIAILNTSGGSWSRSSEVVKTIRRKGA